MRRLTLLSTALLTAVATANLASAEDKPLTGDLAKLQGRWSAEVEIRPGVKWSWLYRIDGSQVRIRTSGTDEKPLEFKEEFRIDESARPHKTIDLVKRSGPGDRAMPDLKAIYAFQGDDILKICQPNSLDGKNRPTEFGPELSAEEANSNGPSTLTLTRLKGDAENDLKNP